MTRALEPAPFRSIFTSETAVCSPWVSRRVESCFGSQPIWSTFFPAMARAAERLALTVDLPMPPLP